jgi:hypothetical protein
MNPWILHVKKYAAEHKLSYKDAMSKAKDTYKKTGGSRNAGYVKKLVAMKKLDINKVKKPSDNLIKIAEAMKPKKIVKKIKVTKPNEETTNDKFKEFQHKLLVQKIPFNKLLKEAISKDLKTNKAVNRKITKRKAKA